jgi:acetyl-CoA synthetase
MTTRRSPIKELYEQVCRLANVMKSNGVKKGDRVTIYMPMIPEAAYAMLACTRIGAVHSIVFGGFSPDALAGRIEDCDSSFVITADEGIAWRQEGSAQAQYRPRDRDRPSNGVTRSRRCWWCSGTAGKIDWVEGRDVWYHEATAAKRSRIASRQRMKAEDPLFILYTSGSTGKPKGVLHTTGGYLVYASMTHEYVFDYHEGDIYWCTADVGWVTGHSYIVYGPLANGATTLMFEGVPNYPSPSRFWDVVDKHKVNIFYTAPTAIRALMGAGDDHVKKPRASRSGRWVGRRADQPGSLGVVLQCRRREEVPDRRHLVADRDWRHPDHATARRDQAQAGLGDAAVLWRAAAAGGQ